jgi:transposase
LDSTSFHVHGDKYDNFRRISIKQGKSEKESINITHGYSRDGHPELAQIMLQMIVDNVAGIPLMMKPQDGNTNDNAGFKSSFHIAKSLINSMKESNQNAYLVADATLYTEANLKELNETDNELLFITRAPSKIKEVSAIIKQAKNDEFKPIKDQYSGVMYDFEYGGVKQKIVVVKSSEANKRVIKAVDNKSQKELEKITQTLTKLGKQDFNCAVGAIRAYEKILKT